MLNSNRGKYLKGAIGCNLLEVPGAGDPIKAPLVRQHIHILVSLLLPLDTSSVVDHSDSDPDPTFQLMLCIPYLDPASGLC